VKEVGAFAIIRDNLLNLSGQYTDIENVKQYKTTGQFSAVN